MGKGGDLHHSRAGGNKDRTVYTAYDVNATLMTVTAASAARQAIAALDGRRKGRDNEDDNRARAPLFQAREAVLPLGDSEDSDMDGGR